MKKNNQNKTIGSHIRELKIKNDVIRYHDIYGRIK
tara:strand:- start:65 stop:169 length:105 start_codon:yes stop_codon:yes gene_type:complete